MMIPSQLVNYLISVVWWLVQLSKNKIIILLPYIYLSKYVVSCINDAIILVLVLSVIQKLAIQS